MFRTWYVYKYLVLGHFEQADRETSPFREHVCLNYIKVFAAGNNRGLILLRIPTNDKIDKIRKTRVAYQCSLLSCNHRSPPLHPANSLCVELLAQRVRIVVRIVRESE